MTKGWEVPPASPAGDVVRAFCTWLGSVETDRLTTADSLDLVAALEATKGAAAALQGRATAAFVEEREAEVADRRRCGEIDERAARQERAAARSEVALARRCSPSQADRHVGLAAALVHELPETMAALTRGEISEWRAALVARGTACLSRADRAEADRRLGPDLGRLGDRSIDRAARRISAELDAASVVERHRRAVASRSVSVRPAPDGMAWLTVLGPLVDVVGAHAALDAAEKRRWVTTGDPAADAARAADDRGRGAWMADTALQLLSGRTETQPQPVEIGLVMTPSTLLPRLGEVDGSPSTTPAEVPGWGSIPGEAAREHLLRLLTGPSASGAGGEETAEPETAAERGARVWLRRLFTSPDGRDLVGMDSRRRLFGGALRTLVTLRDPTCRIPWCDAPTRATDHARPAADGGETSAANGVGLCERHNLDKEHPGWLVEVTSTGLDPGGGPHTIDLSTPTGSTYQAQAPPLRGHGTHPPPARGPARQTGSHLEQHLEELLAAA